MQRVATPRRKNLQSNKTTRSKSWLRACVSWRTKTSSLIFNPKSAPGMILRCPTRLSTSLKNSKWIGHRSSKLTPFPESMTKRVKISSFKLQMVQEKHWLLVSLPSWELTPKLKESRCWSLQTPESWSGKFNRSFRKFAKTPRSHAVLETNTATSAANIVVTVPKWIDNRLTGRKPIDLSNLKLVIYDEADEIFQQEGNHDSIR